jgi:long-chain acyl-CoA synthetase
VSGVSVQVPPVRERPWTRFYDAGVPTALQYPDLLVHQLLEASARRHAGLTALLFFGGRLTYAALDELVSRFAAGLQWLGVRRGTPVSLHLPNSPQFVIAYYGILKAGGIAVPHNPLYTEREVAHQLADARVQVAVTLDIMFPQVASAARRSGVRHLVVTSIQEYMPLHLRLLYPLKAKREGHWVRVPAAPDVHPFSALLTSGAPTPIDLSPDDPALYQYTGGTTGVPKAAVLSHRNLVSNALQAAAWNAATSRPGDRVMAVLPFFHIYGMTAVLNFAIWSGLGVVIVPRFDPTMVLTAAHRTRPTVFHGVPTMYTALLNRPDLARFDLRSIKSCISGAMGLPQEVQRSWEAATGGRLVEGYGLTEASPITHCTPVLGHRRPGSIGVPFPDTDARIADPETGRTLPIGEVGELAVRGPQVMRGYLNRPDETAVALRGGWLFTGDMARMDADGFFYIVDRKKEMINVGGLKVYRARSKRCCIRTRPWRRRRRSAYRIR